MPRVSIIVPSYNHARFIPACVESVLSQSMPDWELIVVDDGSKDDSVAVWKSYSDSRIQVFENEANLGTYGTQNRAVSLAKSDWIAVLNSDDFWEPQKLELQIKLLEKYPNSVLCYTQGWHADENGTVLVGSDNYVGWPSTEQIELLPYLLDFNRLHASSVIWNREFAAFEPDFNVTGDWISSIRAAYVAPAICVPERVSHWRIHGDNTSGKLRSVTKAELQMRNSIVADSKLWFSPRWDGAVARERIGQCAYHLSALEMLWDRPEKSRQASRIALKMMANKVQALRRAVVCLLPREKAAKRFFPQAEGVFERTEVDALPKIDWKFKDFEGQLR